MTYSGNPAQLALWANQVMLAANYVHIADNILWGVFGMETNFGRDIGTSSTGAEGLMQFEPGTARSYNYPMTNYPSDTQSQNQFTAAALYLRDLLNQRGSWDAALRGYSGGGYGLADVLSKADSYAQGTGSDGGTPQPTGAYVNPMKDANVNPERIDQGVDYAGTGYICAIADAVIVPPVGGYWAPYGNYVEYDILQTGPLDGVHIYAAEGIRPLVSEGQHVSAGEHIAELIPGWQYGIECGYAAGDGQAHTWAHVFGGGYDGSNSTRAGIAYDNLVRALGGPGGHVEGTPNGAYPPWAADGKAPDGIVGGAPGQLGPPGGDPNAIRSAFESLDWAGEDINLWKWLLEGSQIAAASANGYWQRLGGWAYVNSASGWANPSGSRPALALDPALSADMGILAAPLPPYTQWTPPSTTPAPPPPPPPPSVPHWTQDGWNAVFNEGWQVGWNDKHHRAPDDNVHRAPSPAALGVTQDMWNDVWNYGFKKGYAT